MRPAPAPPHPHLQGLTCIIKKQLLSKNIESWLDRVIDIRKEQQMHIDV
jgi:hypothetical protein